MKTLRISSIAVVAAILFIGAQTAMADIQLDLTTAGSSGFIDDAYFTWYDQRSTGTGVIDPFVRVSTPNVIEQGYNTSWRPLEYDENSSPQFTHSLAVSDVPIVNIGGTDYLEFLLDINQTGTAPYLSLDELKIYVSDDPYIHGYDNGTETFSVATEPVSKVYDLDENANNYIKLNYNLNTGSGSGDMLAYIPESKIVGGDYLTLWSSFGSNFINNDGYEEWAVRSISEPPPVVPVPGAVLLGMLGLSVVGVKLRKFA